MSQLPPNTYVMTLAVTITLPAGETPEDQDPGLMVTGGDFDPWPGVQIHDVELVKFESVPPSIDKAKAALADAVMRRDGLKP